MAVRPHRVVGARWRLAHEQASARGTNKSGG